MWYEFDQNNSGGFFVCDDKVCATVWIEADSINEACTKAEELGIYFYGVDDGIDCPCCGDRWSRPYQGEKKPTLGMGWTEPSTRIYHKDGRVEELS